MAYAGGSLLHPRAEAKSTADESLLAMDDMVNVDGSVRTATGKLPIQCPGIMAVLISPLRFSM